MGKLFGTDGIRGIANIKLTGELAYNIGKCGAKVLSKGVIDNRKIVVGIDTRISSSMIEYSICAGIASTGIDVIRVSNVPTPAIAYLIQKFKLLGGVMISASHNPYEYNGIKFFDSNGVKLNDDLENEIENLYFNLLNVSNMDGFDDIGKIEFSSEMITDYIDFLLSNLGKNDLSGLKIGVDCANGAAYSIARRVFEATGAEFLIINDYPNGVNINNKCGSTYMDEISKFVVENNCDLGFAYDGDADRCLAVDHEGNIINGDHIMGLIAIYFKEQGILNKNTIVVTVMSNLGLYKSLDKFDISISTVGVGDKYVFQNMNENDYVVGGEQSGHIILFDNKTGDGILTSLIISKIVKEKGKSLKDLCSVIKEFPQLLVNIEVDEFNKRIYKEDKEVNDLINRYENELSGNGRILVRESGTENLIRIMAEGEDMDMIKNIVDDVVGAINLKLKSV